jgi:hypothetical protein
MKKISDYNPVRYNKWYKFRKSKVLFYLSSCKLHIDEERILFIKIIDQAISDLIIFRNSKSDIGQQFFESAWAFLYDDNYRLEWRDEEYNFKELCDKLDYDHCWLRTKIKQKLKKKLVNKI